MQEGRAVMPLTRSHNPSTVWPVPEAFRGIYAHAVELRAEARMLFLSGQLGVAADGSLASDFAPQLERAMDNVEALLAAAGMATSDIVKVNYYLTRADDLPSLGEIRRRRWLASEPPAVTVLVVAALARPEYLIEIDVIAAAR
jgi:enamine deaminase RidA (YjgF/YER057c/UK114 family)